MQDLAAKIIESTGTSLFLTGRAGTGKTTFLKELRARTRKRLIVTAPTGIAAINAGGVTLHSFFQLNFGTFVPGADRAQSSRPQMAFSKEKIKIIRGLDLLVIDEVSMVRADLLDAVDAVLRRFRDRSLPFGGVQLLLIGDLQQLPPVVKDDEKEVLQKHYRSPYFFDSHALSQLDYLTVELKKVYRQSDPDFVALLNAVRENQVNDAVMRALNSRVRPGFNPADSEGYVRLTTHNHLADRINSQRIAALQGDPQVYEAVVTGKFPETSFPVDRHLMLKPGAQVMFVKNDTGAERQFYNGMLARVENVYEDFVTVIPDGGESEIDVHPVVWSNVKYIIDEQTKQITEQEEGSFTQLPLKLAWGITVHKSQGLTFDRAIIDVAGAFAHGQAYVALSRCRSLGGLVLERPIPPHAIINDSTVTAYIDSQRAKPADEAAISTMSRRYELSLIEGMFNFRALFNALEGVVRLLKENFMRIYPETVMNFSTDVEDYRRSLADVGEKFILQVRALFDQGGGAEANPRLRQRIKDASNYFIGQLAELSAKVAALPHDHDNKKVTVKFRERVEIYTDLARLRERLFTAFADEDFTIDRYLDVKADALLDKPVKTRRKKSAGQGLKTKSQEAADYEIPAAGPSAASHKASQASADNLNPELFDTLQKWRTHTAKSTGVPAYVVASTKALLAVANHLPADREELKALSGFGEATVQRIGEPLLAMTARYVDDNPWAEKLPLPDKKKH